MKATALFQACSAALAIASALALAACGRSAPSGAGAPQAASAAADPGYRAPPELDAARAAGDAVSLSGRALASSQVRLESPAGAAVETTADKSGAWTARLAGVSQPILYRLVEDAGGRRVAAEGLIAVLPGPPGVAVLRAGGGAEVQGGPQDGLKILAVDYDGSGEAVISGRAPASSPLRLLVDGRPAIEGGAGADGRFSLTLPRPLEPGVHRLQALTPQGMTDAVVPFTPPSPPKTGVYRASSQPFGWRIDWITAGGGPQTTLLLGG